MTDGEQQQEQVFMPNPMGSQADRGLQEYRTDLTQLLVELRTMCTGEVLRGGQWVKIRGRGLMCRGHWEDFTPNLWQLNKSGILSCLPQEVVQKMTVHFGNKTQFWLASNCLRCQDCNFDMIYGRMSNLVDSLTNHYYNTMMRAVGGFESEKLSTMHHVTTSEMLQKDKNEDKGWFKRR